MNLFIKSKRIKAIYAIFTCGDFATAANWRRFAAFVLADVSGSKTFPFLHEGFRRKQLRQIQ